MLWTCIKNKSLPHIYCMLFIYVLKLSQDSHVETGHTIQAWYKIGDTAGQVNQFKATLH